MTEPATIRIEGKLADTTLAAKFQNAIAKLERIKYYKSGTDSFVKSGDPTEFVELNGLRYCFQDVFDKADTGLNFYKRVQGIIKYHVAYNKKINGPSATIVQITFLDSVDRANWYKRLVSCKEFEMIKLKPKTEIWPIGNHVYFVQSYYDNDRKILDSVLSIIKPALD